VGLSDALTKVLGFLRVGYPNGVPDADRMPILALLRRKLTDDEVVTLAQELVPAGALPVDGTDLRVAITKLTDDVPSPDDIERVKQRLMDAGWPVSDAFDA
jgi:hypothetical protein